MQKPCVSCLTSGHSNVCGVQNDFNFLSFDETYGDEYRESINSGGISY
jgi:hypothetical protein